MRGAWVLPDAEATLRLGAALGEHCPWDAHGPCCLFLSGELGSGKTTLAAAVLAAVGVRETVRSPTYALVETYSTDAGLAVHLDLFRLQGREELEQLGLRDYLQPRVLLVVEWPEHARTALPRPDLVVCLTTAEAGRDCTIQASTVVGEGWLAAIERQLGASDVI